MLEEQGRAVLRTDPIERPGTDRDQMYIQVKLADGRSIYDTQALVKELDKKLRGDPLIRRVDWTIGESPPAFYYNMYRIREGIPSWAEALVLGQGQPVGQHTRHRATGVLPGALGAYR